MEQSSKALSRSLLSRQCGLNQNRAPENMHFERIVDRYLNERKERCYDFDLTTNSGPDTIDVLRISRAHNFLRIHQSAYAAISWLPMACGLIIWMFRHASHG